MARYNSTRGMFDVLTTLRRSGPPHELAPKQLSYSLLLSGAGITNRLDRLENLKLILSQTGPTRPPRIAHENHKRRVEARRPRATRTDRS